MSEPLWAPWRMEYILSKKEGGCIFCTHAEADETVFAQEHVLVATDHALVVLNKYPFAAGHLLVIPRPSLMAMAFCSGSRLMISTPPWHVPRR